MMKLRERQTVELILGIAPVSHLVRRWFLQLGMGFLKGKTFSDSQEKVLEDFTDYCLESLNIIEEYDKKYK